MATIAEIAKAIKKVGLGGPNENVVKSVPAVAKELGEELSGGFVADVYEAEPVAFPELKLKATSAAVKTARQEGLRFERIAARTGMTVADVRDMAESAGVGSDFYVGRGRRGNGSTNGASATTKQATSGRRGAKKEEPKATSGRRGRKAEAAESKTKTAAAKTRGRRGTRAAANPK